jgi:hypothetical protein
MLVAPCFTFSGPLAVTVAGKFIRRNVAFNGFVNFLKCRLI